MEPARARSARHQRVARVTVRVGDYKTDSSGGRGDGALELAALDDDPIALRSALWAATDQAYKSALAAYAQKQAALKQVQTPPQADDFSQEKPLISLAEPVALKLDEGAWAERVARASGLYRTDPAGQARARATCSTRRRSFSARDDHLAGQPAREPSCASRRRSTRRRSRWARRHADGMRLDRSYASTGSSLKDLDAPEVFEKHARGADCLARRAAQGAAG